jgi:hypothetical protein
MYTFSHIIHYLFFHKYHFDAGRLSSSLFYKKNFKFKFSLPVQLGVPSPLPQKVQRLLSCAFYFLRVWRGTRSDWLTRQATAGAATAGHSEKIHETVAEKGGGGGGRYSRKYVRISLAQTGVITGSKQVYKEESL